MDNYLSHRWPAPVPGRQRPQPRPRSKRRVWLDVLIVLLAVVLLAGMVTGAIYGVRYVAEQMMAQSGADPDASPLPGGGLDLPGVAWTPDVLPQGEPDPSLRLDLLSNEGQSVLTAGEIYGKVLPSIVCVQASGPRGSSIGSGVIISASGYIITNYHVIEEGLELAVMLLSDDSVYEAALVGYDKELDLAILKADGSGFTPARLGSSDELKVGDMVYAIGNPMGYLYGSMTDGIVSGFDEERIPQLDYPGRLIQTSAALNSGNSGGALVDAYGRVVGITSAKVTGVWEDVVTEGIGLAIPLSDARPYLDRILRTGHSARPSIGISCYREVRDGVAGIYVAEVTEDSPADGKLIAGDFILSANGIPATSVDAMTRVFAEMDPGDEVTLVVQRRHRQLTVTVTLYDRLPELQ